MPPPPPSPPLSYTMNPSLPETYTSTTLPVLTSQSPDRLVVGIAVLHHTPAPRILILKRAPAEFLANRWELPGGSADPEDPSLAAAAARELHEETALRARNVAAFLGSYSWMDTGRRWRKLSFVMEVEGGDGDAPPQVGLDPEEHQDFVWASEEEVRGNLAEGRRLEWTSEEQKGDVLRAFEMARAGAPSS